MNAVARKAELQNAECAHLVRLRIEALLKRAGTRLPVWCDGLAKEIVVETLEQGLDLRGVSIDAAARAALRAVLREKESELREYERSFGPIKLALAKIVFLRRWRAHLAFKRIVEGL